MAPRQKPQRKTRSPSSDSAAPAEPTKPTIPDLDPVTAYAQAVTSGAIVAGPHVRNECARHLRDMENGHLRGLRFDRAKAERNIRFFPTVLRLNGGQFEGLPFRLEPVQEFIVGSLFGWVRIGGIGDYSVAEDGLRRFRVAYIEMGKGGGKSPLVAGIGLLGLVADGEPRAEVYSAASKKDQAAILFRDAVAMVKQSPALSAATKLSGRDDKVWNIFHPGSESFFRPISSEQGQSGPRPHIGLIDELHEHRDGTVINMMSAGRKWRRQPLIIAITNSGHDRNSVCWEYHQMGVKISAGAEHDDTFFSYICALDAEDDPFADEECWIKANPLLGPILTHQYLRDEVNQARGMPSKESTVRRLNFCQWTEAHCPAYPMEIWDACKADFKLEDFAGMPCKLGLDLSGSVDLTSAVFEFVKDGKFWIFPMFWIPREQMVEKSKKDHATYVEWERAGLIKTTPGKAINKDHVVKDIMTMMRAAKITVSELVYDRWFIDEFKAACDRQGATFEMVECGQGYKDMSPAIKEFETSLMNDEIRHNGNPCLRWNIASSVHLEDAAGNKKYDKVKATGRIDGAVAATMAHSRAVLNRPKPEPRIRWL
jgi:phage terminase large subunit-like protein